MLSIARRLYNNAGGSRISASAVRIATAGVAIGVLVMVMSLSIALGFQNEVRRKVADIAGYIEIVNAKSMYQSTSLPIQITDSLVRELRAVPGVVRVQRYAVQTGMFKTTDAFRGTVVRGIGTEYDLTFIRSCMAEGHIPQFGAGDTPSDSIIISGRTAAALKLKTGDRVYAYFFTNQLRARRYIVAGIFNTYMSDFDDNLVFADVRNVQGIAHWDKDIYSGAEVILPGFQDLNEIAMQVGRVVLSLTDSNGQYYANPTVREIYPQIFSWLTLLDTNVIAILILMICVACVTMVSGLLIIILERTQFIGIMKAMGATNSQLRHLFLYLSAMIVVRGIVVGNAIAFALLYLQKYTGIAKLDPANYYLNTVPVSFPWTQIAIVNISTLIICVLVLVIPSYLVSRIHPAKSIRFE